MMQEDMGRRGADDAFGLSAKPLTLGGSSTNSPAGDASQGSIFILESNQQLLLLTGFTF